MFGFFPYPKQFGHFRDRLEPSKAIEYNEATYPPKISRFSLLRPEVRSLYARNDETHRATLGRKPMLLTNWVEKVLSGDD